MDSWARNAVLRAILNRQERAAQNVAVIEFVRQRTCDKLTESILLMQRRLEEELARPEPDLVLVSSIERLVSDWERMRSDASE